MYLSLVTSLVCTFRVLFIILSLSGRVFFYAANWRRACLQHIGAVERAAFGKVGTCFGKNDNNIWVHRAESFLRSVQSLAKHHIFVLLWTILCQ
jgi:hypothetical protein